MDQRTRTGTGIILLLGLLTAFGPASIDMYLPAFPAIARDFGTDISHVQYTLATFNIGIALGQLLYGPLADQYGRKPNLIFGMLVYALASIGCALTHAVSSMIAFRLLQAVGGCTGMVISRAIVRDKFRGDESARIFSIMMLVMGVAPILAPSIGGFLLLHYTWRYIFGVLALLGVFTLVCVLFGLPESLPVEKRNPHAVKNSLKTYRQVLQDKQFIGYALTAGFVQGGMFAYITGSSFVFIQLFHLSAQQYGILFGSNAAGLIAASQLNGFLLKHMHFSKILSRIVIFYLFASLLLFIMACLPSGNLWRIAIPLFLCISCVGFTIPNATAGALLRYGTHAGSASALLGTLMFSCGALSAAMVSLLANGTAWPMALVIALCGISACTVFYTLVHGRESGIASKSV